MTQKERAHNRRELIGEIVKAIKEELWMEFLLAGIATPPDYWDPFDKMKMAERLRVVADELDPQQGRDG